MEIRFVPAREEDAETFTALRKRMWETTYRGIYPDEVIDGYDYALHRQRDLTRLRDPRNQAFLICDGDTPVGYYILRDGEPLYLQSLYCLPDYRRRGIGREVFHRAADYGRRLGRSSFTCNCNAHNEPALAFYRAMGGEAFASDLGHENPQEDQISFRFPIDA